MSSQRSGKLPGKLMACLAMLGLAALLTAPAQGQLPPGMKPFAVDKIADGVYTFRAFFHRNIFIVTPKGVIVTDPLNARAAKRLMSEIRKITSAPIRYVIYSHQHWDHAAGGKIFKDAGARFISHANCVAHFKDRPNPQVVMPDGTYKNSYTISLGGKTVRLLYFGPNHSDCMTILHLPKERLAFAVDFFSPRSLPYRALYDVYPHHVMDSLRKLMNLDVDRIVPGHGPPTAPMSAVGELLLYWRDLIDAVTTARNNKLSIDEAKQQIKLEKYAKWGGYQWLPLNIERIYLWQRIGY